MTKEELIAKMAASAGITKVAAGTALEAFTGAVTSSLKKGHRVSLVNRSASRHPRFRSFQRGKSCVLP
jgi:nucleoid DNA-binding protein